MNKRIALIVVALVLSGLILAACGPGDALPAPANLPDAQVIDPNAPTLTPVPLTGGSYKDPNIVVTSSCSSYGDFTFDVRYLPADLSISQAGTSSAIYREGCTKFKGGHFQCSAVLNPANTRPVDFLVYYDPGTGVTNVKHVPVYLAGCPGFVPSAQLVSVTCLPGDRVGFVINTGTKLKTFYTACLGDTMCLGAGSHYYDPDRIFNYDELEYSFNGAAPTRSSPPLRFFLRVSGQDPDSDNYMVVFDNFYQLYVDACRTTIVGVPPTPTSETAGGQPPAPSCSGYTDADACKIGGCFWWSDGACHADQEPPAQVCGDYNGIQDKCELSGCWYWANGTCSDSQDPCSIYFDKDSCVNQSCSWDGVKTCSTP